MLTKKVYFSVFFFKNLTFVFTLVAHTSTYTVYNKNIQQRSYVNVRDCIMYDINVIKT